jgi:hypothetical protein
MPYIIKGSHHSEESKKKMVEAWKIRKKTFIPPFKLRKPSKKTRFKMGISQKKRFENPEERKSHGLRLSKIARSKYPKSKISGSYVGIFEENAPIGTRRVREHRYVIEKHLGIKLKSEWHVHHINRIPSDNNLKNLILFKSDSAHIRFHKDPSNVLSSEILFDGRNLPTLIRAVKHN